MRGPGPLVKGGRGPLIMIFTTSPKGLFAPACACPHADSLTHRQAGPALSTTLPF